MQILITGSSGFLGNNLILKIEEVHPDWQIHGIDIVNPVNQNINFKEMDFRKDLPWEDYLKDIKPDIIFHLAGIYGKVDFDSMYKINTSQTLSLIESIRKLELDPKFITIGSAAQYGKVELEANPIKENYPQNPFSLYGFTKKWQEEIALFYHHTYGIKTICTRPSNFIGQGISSKLLPGYLTKVFKEANDNVQVKVSSTTAERDYIDVRDASEILLKLCEKDSCIGNVFNISSSLGTTNGELIGLFEEISKKKANISSLDIKDDFKIRLDNTNLKNQIDWKIKHTLKNSISWSLL